MHKYEVYKIVIIMCRIETINEDKELRAKYKILKHTKPEDYGIAEYFLLNEDSP